MGLRLAASSRICILRSVSPCYKYDIMKTELRWTDLSSKHPSGIQSTVWKNSALMKDDEMKACLLLVSIAGNCTDSMSVP